MQFNKILLALLVVLTVVSCRKDDVSDPTIPTTGVPSPWETFHTYTIDVQGIVKAPDGTVISDAKIFVLGQETSCTEEGTFLVQKIEAPQTGIYVKAIAEGYFVGGTSVYSYKNQVYTVEITLIPVENFQQFDATDGLDFVSDDGAEVRIPANGIVDEAGNPYTGSVDFYTYWIDPTDENLTTLSPGSLLGVLDEELVALQSYGMIGVELIGSAGQELNLANGVKADLKFPVPNEIISSASPEINLWHFNETTGKWDAEGTATLVNGFYEAEVSHFSWWNCDVPLAAAYFCFNVVDAFDDPVGNVTLSVYVDGFGFASANVGPDGSYCDLVPLGQDMDVVLTTVCGDILWQETIPGITDDNDVEIVVPLGSANVTIVNVSGTVGCGADDVVTNGYVVMTLGDETYFDYVDDQGAYSLNMINCLEQNYNTSITAYNLDELLGGTDELTVGVDNFTHDIDACQEDFAQEILSVNNEGEMMVLFQCEANISVAEITIIAKDPTGVTNEAVILGVVGFSEGDHTGNLILNSGLVGLDNAGLNAVEFTIDNYSDVPGEKIVGSFAFGADVSGYFVATVQ